MARIESAPLDLVVAVHQGIDVCFAGLKLSTVPPPWQEYSEDYDAVDSSGFEFKLRSLANDVTRELDAGFNKNLEIWNAQVKEFGASVAGRAPSLPSDIFFEHICAEVEDDLGTEYVWIGGEGSSRLPVLPCAHLPAFSSSPEAAPDLAGHTRQLFIAAIGPKNMPRTGVRVSQLKSQLETDLS